LFIDERSAQISVFLDQNLEYAVFLVCIIGAPRAGLLL
jgi:hypothetical protein